MHWRTLMASYDRFSTLYDSAFSAQQAPKIRALTTAMWGSARPTTGAQVIVDLGAGTGLFGRMTGIAAIEVDFSRQMLSSPRRPRAIQALLHQLPFRDASVDVLVSITSLIDFDHVLPEVDECRRVLRPGGALLLSVLKREDLSALDAALDAAGLMAEQTLDLGLDRGQILRRV